jgi:drug/metabolite transporter (DMT)-like permease
MIRTPANIHARGREKFLGHCAALLFALIIAGSFALGDKAAPFMDPAALNTVRFVLSAVVVAAIFRMARGSWPKPPAAPWRFAVLGSLFGIYFITMFIGLRLSSPVSTSAVFTLIPIMSAGFGLLLLHQTTRPVVLLSLAVAASGSLWVIFRGDMEAILKFEIGRGEAVFLVGCACHAAYAPLLRLYRRDESQIEYTLWIVIGTAAFLTVFGLRPLLATDFAALPAIVWIAIAYLSILATAITTFLLQYAAVRLPASKVLSYGYLTPVFVIAIEGLTGFGWTNLSVLGGAIVIASALLVMALAPDA